MKFLLYKRSGLFIYLDIKEEFKKSFLFFNNLIPTPKLPTGDLYIHKSFSLNV
jgi:hypothetical protein